tara:strand:- start:255 stop:452 length:198 start_codon:yes stop_codon:yes gene_type:complete
VVLAVVVVEMHHLEPVILLLYLFLKEILEVLVHLVILEVVAEADMVELVLLGLVLQVVMVVQEHL